MKFPECLRISWWVLRLALGVVPIVAGIDKYFNRLADWEMYLSPYTTKAVLVSTAAFVHMVGAVEIVAGLMVWPDGGDLEYRLQG
jgi:uncharacterized membrane protein YphA (DoxX/SURF4 family)